MKKIFLILLLAIPSVNLFSEDLANVSHWTNGTAYTISKHRAEVGVFTGSRYGLTDDLELSTRPLLFFVAPQLKLKKSWGEHSGFQMATEHGILYPTPLMRLLARKGIGGLISDEFAIPQMFAIDNRFFISSRPFENTILSAHAGITFAIKSGKPDPASTIDLPVVYPRLAVFYNQPEFDFGLDFQGNFSTHFGYIFNVENFILPQTTRNYFFENNGILTYSPKKQSLRLEGGYKLCYGKYPSGNQWHLLPKIALIFCFGSNR